MRITLLVASLLFSVLLPAQVDKKAKEVLDQVSAKTRSYTSMRAEFSYSLVNTDRKINTSQNWKLLLKGNSFRLDMGEQLIISDGKNQWKILKADKEVEVSAADNTDEGINPRNIFTMYEKGFKYKYVKEDKLGAKTVHVIDLFPENPKEKDFSSVRLYIDKATLQVAKSELKGKNGNVYTYDIKKFVTNETLDQSQFTYKASEYPGYEVNDLR